ncbi:MAG TPA: maleylpyruvate isomerase N-terminal domain-containing protein [Candidatus Dormibacteraeota bacterium]|nr:maleylpyruvate isomerase N-terminal domain-containing protein [Candidatus Dormibacteraeota bacterium]
MTSRASSYICTAYICTAANGRTDRDDRPWSPAGARIGAHGDEWGTHEVLSHLVFWHETYVRIVRALIRGKHTALTGVFRDFNELAVETFRDSEDQALGRRLAAAQRDLAEELASLPAPARIRIKSGAMARGPAQFADRIAAHIRGHLSDLRHKSRRLPVQRSLRASALQPMLRA